MERIDRFDFQPCHRSIETNDLAIAAYGKRIGATVEQGSALLRDIKRDRDLADADD